MKLFFLPLLILIISSEVAFAQDYVPSWGESLKRAGKLNSTMEIIDIDDNNYYVLMNTDKGSVLHTHSLDHKFIGGQELEFTNSNVVIDNMITSSYGKFGLLNMIDRKAKEWVLFRSEFDNGVFSKPKEIFAHRIGKRTVRTGDALYSPDRETDPIIGISQDSSKIVFVNMLDNSDDGNEELAIAVFNEQLELQWSKIQLFDYMDTDLSIKSANITNNGELYLVARKTEWNNLFKSDDPLKEIYKIFKVSEKGLTEIEVNIGKQYATNQLKIINSKDDSSGIMLCGFYTDADRRVGFKGMFLAKFDGTSISDVKIHQLSEDFIRDMVSKRRIKKDKGLEANFEINEIFYYDDGSFGFVAESYYWDRYNSYNSIGTINGSTLFFYSNEIIIPRFSSDGALLNLTKILKYFNTTDRSETSYAFAFQDENIYLVYNNQAFSGRFKYDTDIAVISKNGGNTYNSNIFNVRDSQLDFKPGINYFENNKMLITKAMGKKYSVGIIELK